MPPKHTSSVVPPPYTTNPIWFSPLPTPSVRMTANEEVLSYITALFVLICGFGFLVMILFYTVYTRIRKLWDAVNTLQDALKRLSVKLEREYAHNSETGERSNFNTTSVRGDSEASERDDPITGERDRAQNSTLGGECPQLRKPALPVQPLTAEQVLGIDKQSYVRHNPPIEAGRSSRVWTVAPFSTTVSATREDDNEIRSRNAAYVNPWDMEKMPNPVMFPHLYNPDGRGHATDARENALRSSANKDRKLLSGIFRDLPKSKNLADYMTEPLPAVAVAHRNSVRDQCCFMDQYAPFRASSSTLDTMSRASSGETEPLLSPASSGSPASSVKNQNAKELLTALDRDPKIESYGASLDSVPGDLALQCLVCACTFPTLAQKNRHMKRKNIRRFPCTFCERAFKLRADLGRHERTIHKDICGASQLFHCPNAGCATPEKEYTRKDNFEKHVKRCKKRLHIL